MYMVNINGKEYNTPPFSAGMMRRLVSPVMDKSAGMIALINAPTSEKREITTEEVVHISKIQRELVLEHTDIVLACLKQQYPELTLDDVETLTPTHISKLFNKIYLMTISGANEVGEK